MQNGYAVWLSVVGAIALTACSDYPTEGNRDKPSSAPVLAVSAQPQELTDYVCATTEKALLGYRRGLIWIKFPKAFEAKNRATELYKMRIKSPSGEILAAADCRIPRTPSARAAMDRRLEITLDRAAHKKPSAVISEGPPLGNKPPTRSPKIPPASIVLGMPEKKGVAFDLPTVIVTAIYNVWPGWGAYGNNCDWDCQEEMSNGGMSQYGQADPEPDLLPCPPSDPNCLGPLSAMNLQMISIVLDNLRKPLSSISDPTARAQCAMADSAFATLLQDKKVYRGNWESPDPSHPSDTSEPHWGAYSQTTGNMHIEPSLFDSVNVGSTKWQYVLANTLLHEGIHSRGIRHLGDTGTYNPHISESRDYSTPPFNVLNGGSPNSCLNLYP